MRKFAEGKVLGITLGVIAVVLGLIATIGLWMWYFSSRLKHRDRISGTKGPKIVLKYFSVKDLRCG
jgi:hypothetical protein